MFPTPLMVRLLSPGREEWGKKSIFGDVVLRAQKYISFSFSHSLFGYIGYRDIIAIPDLSTYRRIPWEHNIPFFLLSFYEPTSREPLAVCPRGVLKRVTDQLASLGWEAMCGAEFEFFNFKGNKKLDITDGWIMYLQRQ